MPPPLVSPRRLLSLLLLTTGLAVLSAACQVNADVLVDVAEDGSGAVVVTVTLDPEAGRRLGDPGAQLRLDDLRSAGWDVEEPVVDPDGTVTLRATREFGSPSQLPTVLDEIGGTDGVFDDTQLVVTDGFGEVEYSFSSQVELSGSPEQFSDEFLAGALGGLPLARTPEELAFEGAADPDTMDLTVRVALPGGVPETDGQLVDGAATWTFPATGGTATSATIESATATTSAQLRVLIGLGVLALVASIAAALVGLQRRRDRPAGST